jgi:hypothetical protein
MKVQQVLKDFCLQVSDNTKDVLNNIQTIVILDRSSSMGEYYNQMLRHLHVSFLNVGFKPSDIIHLITFDKKAVYAKMTVDNFRTDMGKMQGKTYFQPALDILNNIVKSFNCMNIITISDGDMFDIEKAKTFATTMIPTFKDFPSYLAFGFMSIQDLIDNASYTRASKYFQLHTNCCGTCNYVNTGSSFVKRIMF